MFPGRWILTAALAAATLSAAGCSTTDDDDAADDDAADDDDSLTPVALSECMLDPTCEYLFSCGHRGTTMFAPENTLIGYETAIELGMDAVEFDVRPTLDEVLVLMHDSTVDRTTDGSGEVSEMTLEEIRALNVVSTHDGIPDQPVPTFAEGLEALSGRALINVDAKTDRMDLIAADIAAAGMQRWCFVQVDSVEEGEELRAGDPTIPMMPDAADASDVATYQALNPELFEFNTQVIDQDAVDAALALDIRPTADALGVQDAAALVHEANGDDFCIAFEPMLGQGITLIQTDVPHLLAPCLAPLNAAAGYSGPE